MTKRISEERKFTLIKNKGTKDQKTRDKTKKIMTTGKLYRLGHKSTVNHHHHQLRSDNCEGRQHEIHGGQTHGYKTSQFKQKRKMRINNGKIMS